MNERLAILMSDAYEIFQQHINPVKVANYFDYLLEFADLNGLTVAVSAPYDIYKEKYGHRYMVDLMYKKEYFDVLDGCMRKSQAYTGLTLDLAARELLNETYKQKIVFGMGEGRREVFCNYIGLKSLLDNGTNI